MHSKDMLSNKKTLRHGTLLSNYKGHNMIFKNGKRRNSMKSSMYICIYIYACIYTIYVVYFTKKTSSIYKNTTFIMPRKNIFIWTSKREWPSTVVPGK